MGFKRRFDKEFKRAVAEEIISGIISVAAASVNTV
jgi:transposase-like protein